MKGLIVVFLALFVMMSAQASYAQQTIYGMGRHSCGKYITALEGYRQNNHQGSLEYFEFLCWFYGFATAVSGTLYEDILHGKDNDAITLWLEKYCRAHPMDEFIVASINLVGGLRGKK